MDIKEELRFILFPILRIFFLLFLDCYVAVKTSSFALFFILAVLIIRTENHTTDILYLQKNQKEKQEHRYD